LAAQRPPDGALGPAVNPTHLGEEGRGPEAAAPPSAAQPPADGGRRDHSGIITSVSHSEGGRVRQSLR
jgi:hypothetical protein